MSTDDLTIESKIRKSQVTDIPIDNTRTKKLNYLKNKIKTGDFAIIDKKNSGFAASCAKIAKKLVS